MTPGYSKIHCISLKQIFLILLQVYVRHLHSSLADIDVIYAINNLCFILFDPGRYYLVDSGYPNQDGYLSPYIGTKYHLPEFRIAATPSGKKEIFNHAHSSLRNAIERAFGGIEVEMAHLAWYIKLPNREADGHHHGMSSTPYLHSR